MQDDQIKAAVARVRPQSLHHIADAVIEQVAAGLTITRYVDGWRVTVDRNEGVWSVCASPTDLDDNPTAPPDEVVAFAMFLAGDAGAAFGSPNATFTPAHNISAYTPATFRLVWIEGVAR